MVSEQEAVKIASEHIVQRNREYSVFGEAHIRWKVATPVEYPNFWYFEYEFDTLSNSDVMHIGSPGYSVSKSDGSVKTISRQEYHKLIS